MRHFAMSKQCIGMGITARRVRSFWIELKRKTLSNGRRGVAIQTAKSIFFAPAPKRRLLFLLGGVRDCSTVNRSPFVSFWTEQEQIPLRLCRAFFRKYSVNIKVREETISSKI